MKEIRELTGNGLPYRSREELEVALSPHFDILYSEEELIPLSFEDPIKVLYHLKQTGVNGLSTQSSPAGKQENDLCSSDDNSKNNLRTIFPNSSGLVVTCNSSVNVTRRNLLWALLCP